MQRMMVLAYGSTAYAVFLGMFSLLFAFLAGMIQPAVIPEEAWGGAAAIDVALVTLFGLQHSVMARSTFKAWWTRFVPREMERSTYVWATNTVLALLIWQWKPVGVLVWNVSDPSLRMMIWCLFGLGWLKVLATTFLINHFDLFGLRQVWLHARSRACKAVGFSAPGPYRIVRHPLYVGWLMTFWSAPTMTADRMIFAVGMTAYILMAIPWEERNLLEAHGEAYAEYRRRVPMLLPSLSSLTGRVESPVKAELTATGTSRI